MCRRGISGVKAKVGREWRARWARLNRGGIQTKEVREESHSVVSRRSRDTAAGQLQEGELPRVLNVEKESGEHFGWAHLEKVQHCTDLPHQVTFPTHTELAKTGPGLG